MRTVEVDEDRLQAEIEQRAWGDGLPVIAPTSARVEEMLAAADVEADELLGAVPERGVVATAGQAAVNAVMAGCEPRYFPLVLAAVGACLDPAFNLPVVCTSTGGAAIAVVVSGPLVAELGLNAAHNALGPGNRANATIGRAVRLAAVNLLGVRRDGTDGTSLGHPGKYTLCLAERPPRLPWTPLTESLGYGPEATSVTVVPADSPRQLANHLSADPDDLVETFAAALRSPWHFPVGKGGMQAIVVVGPEHEQAFTAAGWSQARLREALVERSRISPEALRGAGVPLEQDAHHDMTPGTDGRLTTVASSDDLLVVTAGGAGAGWSAVIPAWAPRQHSQAVSRRVRGPGEPLPACGPDGCVIETDL